MSLVEWGFLRKASNLPMVKKGYAQKTRKAALESGQMTLDTTRLSHEIGVNATEKNNKS